MPAPNNEQPVRHNLDDTQVRNVLVRSGLNPSALEPEDLVLPSTSRGYEITNDIFVSHWIPAFQRDFLEAFNVKAIICLSGHHSHTLAEQLGVEKIFSISMPDGPGTTADMILKYTEKLKEFIDNHGRTLVHCQAGQSRSPSIVAAYLVRYKDMALPEALRLVREARAPQRDVKYWPETLSAIREALNRL